MNKFSIKASLATAALALAGQANAADLPAAAPPYKTPAPVAQPAYSWSGFYAGVNAGGAWGRDAVNTAANFGPGFLVIDNAAVSNATSSTLSPSGFTGGAQAGYNYQTGNLVLGMEADFDYLGQRASSSGTFPFPSTLPGGPIGPPTTFFSAATSVSADWLFTARPRVGWAVDNWLFYATGGLAVGKERFTQTINLLAPFVSTASFSTTRVGWTAGAGVQYALNTNWSIKAEYLYVDLGTVNKSAIEVPVFAGFALNTSSHLTTNIARAGINYRF